MDGCCNGYSISGYRNWACLPTHVERLECQVWFGLYWAVFEIDMLNGHCFSTHIGYIDASKGTKHVVVEKYPAHLVGNQILPTKRSPRIDDNGKRITKPELGWCHIGEKQESHRVCSFVGSGALPWIAFSSHARLFGDRRDMRHHENKNPSKLEGVLHEATAVQGWHQFSGNRGALPLSLARDIAIEAGLSVCLSCTPASSCFSCFPFKLSSASASNQHPGPF